MMRITFLGDIGVAGPVAGAEGSLPAWTDSDLVVANLEGAILSEDELRTSKRTSAVALHNSPAVLDLLQAMNVGCVSLANNHVYDFDRSLASTRARLDRGGIGSFGAGETLQEAGAPFVFSAGATTVRLFGFGWPVIGCRAAGARRRGVNPLVARHALATVRRARSADPDALIVVVTHWNYELELYPQPAHRQLARALIEAGADAIIGGHPHVAGGVEIVGGKPVAYSLGNWLFPPRDVDGFKLSYPPVAARQLAVDMEVEGREIGTLTLRWHHYHPELGRIEALDVERLEGVDGMDGSDAPVARDLTPYAGMSHEAYHAWFQKHRIRRRGLPVYADYRAGSNVGRDAYLRLRRRAGDVLARLGLKREQRRRPSPGARG